MSWDARDSSAPDATSSGLLLRLSAGEPAALEELYATYSGYVMAIALRILGNREEAEEVVQDVFWRLWKSGLRYDPTRGRFTTWLFAVARNRALDSLRKRRRAPTSNPISAVPELQAPDDPEGDASRVEQRATIRAALRALPEHQRQAIELAYYRGLTHREISELIGEPLGTIKSRIKRGMDQLKGSFRALEARA